MAKTLREITMTVVADTSQFDDALARLAAVIAQRDAEITELERRVEALGQHDDA